MDLSCGAVVQEEARSAYKDLTKETDAFCFRLGFFSHSSFTMNSTLSECLVRERLQTTERIIHSLPSNGCGMMLHTEAVVCH
jgi:hypothetical protein